MKHPSIGDIANNIEQSRMKLHTGSIRKFQSICRIPTHTFRPVDLKGCKTPERHRLATCAASIQALADFGSQSNSARGTNFANAFEHYHSERPQAIAMSS